jgi:DeoR/GlpR family transcriptional regulator of sugar metabolism
MSGQVNSRFMVKANGSTAAGIEALLSEERRMQIVQLVRRNGRVLVRELSERFSTSTVTIRNDLNDLHRRGLIVRYRGGAVHSESGAVESSLSERLRAHAAEKRRIGAAAAAMVKEGETIILDSGTTTQEIARNLKGKKGLQVITNGVNVAMELLGVQGIQLVIVGGILRADSVSVVGSFAENMLEHLSADRLFLGAASCDPDFGPSTPNLEESLVNQAMVKIAREVVLVVDSTKFDKRSMSRIAPLSSIHKVITDKKITPEIEEKLRSAGCEVVLV